MSQRGVAATQSDPRGSYSSHPQLLASPCILPRTDSRDTFICWISLAPAIPHALKAKEQLPGSAVWDPKLHPNGGVALIFPQGQGCSVVWWSHGITECALLKRTHKDHPVQLLALQNVGNEFVGNSESLTTYAHLVGICMETLR